jgi:hypothetical protein
MAYLTLDPTGQSSDQRQGLAPRPATLDGATLGLLFNTKRNGDRLIAAAADLLGERYRIKEVVSRTKGHFAMPADPTLLDELTARCDVVLTAIGD